jgi:hypothetical protein
MGELKREGEDPFNLPPARQVRAFGSDNDVTLSFSVSFAGGPLQKVHIQVSRDNAVSLLGELKKALT